MIQCNARLSANGAVAAFDGAAVIILDAKLAVARLLMQAILAIFFLALEGLGMKITILVVKTVECEVWARIHVCRVTCRAGDFCSRENHKRPGKNDHQARERIV
jgi:hypothetical protein